MATHHLILWNCVAPLASVDSPRRPMALLFATFEFFAQPIFISHYAIAVDAMIHEAPHDFCSRSHVVQ